MGTSNLVSILAVILIVVAGMFFLDKYLNKKLKGPGSIIWRFRIGIVQLIIAVTAFIWAKERLPFRVFSNKLIIIGIIILAIVGIGDIVIALLNSASGKRSRK
jgi:hypothetical protein